MSNKFNQVVGTIKDLVANNDELQRAASDFAFQELKAIFNEEIKRPIKEDHPSYQMYYELVSSYMTKVLIQCAQDQRNINSMS
jgi:hypothetical protein